MRRFFTSSCIRSAFATPKDRLERIQKLVRKHRFLEVFQQMQTQENHEISPFLEPTVHELYSFAKSTKNPLVVHMFASLVPTFDRKLRKLAFDRLVTLHIDLGDLESAVACIRKIQVANAGEYQFEYRLMEHLVLACVWYQDIDVAFEAMQTIVNSDQQVYARTWGMFLSLILKTDNYPALKWFFDMAASPGHIVLDDHSYISMSRIAAQNGDFSMCRWLGLRMRRRQRALKIPDRFTMEMAKQMYIYLAEAAAYNGLAPDVNTGSVKASCRYLIRLRDTCSEVSTSDLPNIVASLSDNDVFEYVIGVYDEMVADAMANEATVTLLFNVLLKSLLSRNLHAAHELIMKGRGEGTTFNDETYLLCVELALKMEYWSFLQFILSSCGHPTPRLFLAACRVGRELKEDCSEYILRLEKMGVGRERIAAVAY